MRGIPKAHGLGRVAVVVLACSILLGVGGRVVMAILAALEGTGPGFTAGGTLEVIATGVLIGVPTGVVLVIGHFRIRRSSRAIGAACGGLVFLGLTIVPPPAARSAAMAASSTVLLAAFVLFGLLFVLWGATLSLTLDQFLKRG